MDLTLFVPVLSLLQVGALGATILRGRRLAAARALRRSVRLAVARGMRGPLGSAAMRLARGARTMLTLALIVLRVRIRLLGALVGMSSGALTIALSHYCSSIAVTHRVAAR